MARVFASIPSRTPEHRRRETSRADRTRLRAPRSRGRRAEQRADMRSAAGEAKDVRRARVGRRNLARRDEATLTVCTLGLPPPQHCLQGKRSAYKHGARGVQSAAHVCAPKWPCKGGAAARDGAAARARTRARRVARFHVTQTSVVNEALLQGEQTSGGECVNSGGPGRLGGVEGAKSPRVVAGRSRRGAIASRFAGACGPGPPRGGPRRHGPSRAHTPARVQVS